MSGASNGETSSSSSTSQNLGSTSESAVGSASVPTRKRNRSIVVSDKYSQLVDYEVAPAEFQSWITAASTSLTSFGTEAGRRTAEFNINRVVRSRVQSSDIGVAAVEEPDENEARDMDFLASSNLVFFEFLGPPGPLAYIKCLGYLSDLVGEVDFTQRRLIIQSPIHFLLASGDFAAIAAKMRLEKAVSGKALQPELREKRPAQGAQEAGVSAQKVRKEGDIF